MNSKELFPFFKIQKREVLMAFCAPEKIKL
nr:MAG TPA: hypothetical protein [Caudoviricetes sp.]